MTANTANRGYTYPQSTDDFRPYEDIQALAEDLDADVQSLADAQQIRKGTTIVTADSSTWNATESSILTVSATLVAGLKYRVWFAGRISSDATGDSANIRIRENNLAGNQLLLGQIYLANASGNGFSAYFYTEYTAASSASKTFAFTAQRSAGSGTAHRIRADPAAPAYFAVDRVMS